MKVYAQRLLTESFHAHSASVDHRLSSEEVNAGCLTIQTGKSLVYLTLDGAQVEAGEGGGSKKGRDGGQEEAGVGKGGTAHRRRARERGWDRQGSRRAAR